MIPEGAVVQRKHFVDEASRSQQPEGRHFWDCTTPTNLMSGSGALTSPWLHVWIMTNWSIHHLGKPLVSSLESSNVAPFTLRFIATLLNKACQDSDSQDHHDDSASADPGEEHSVPDQRRGSVSGFHLDGAVSYPLHRRRCRCQRDVLPRRSNVQPDTAGETHDRRNSRNRTRRVRLDLAQAAIFTVFWFMPAWESVE